MNYGQRGSTPAAYSGVSEFKSQKGDWLSCLRFSLFLSVLPPDKCQNNISDYRPTISFHILSDSLFATTLPFDVIMEIPEMCLERPKKGMQASDRIAGFWQVIYTHNLLNTKQDATCLVRVTLEHLMVVRVL
jgi:hypothetical protein